MCIALNTDIMANRQRSGKHSPLIHCLVNHTQLEWYVTTRHHFMNGTPPLKTNSVLLVDKRRFGAAASEDMRSPRRVKAASLRMPVISDRPSGVSERP
jgi:hypothetical protein